MPRRTLLALALLAAAPAAAQPQLVLETGFQPDPFATPFEVRGKAPAEERVRGCPGHLPTAAALLLTLPEAATPLRFFARGGELASLVVEGPDGISRCGQADAQGVAGVVFERPLSGRYALHPAAAAPDAIIGGELLISELALDPAALSEAEMSEDEATLPLLALDAEPAAGRHAWPLEGALSLDLPLPEATEAAPAEAFDAGCAGMIDPTRPGAVLTTPELETRLVFRARSEGDATLLVVDPSGGVHCNDDHEDYDPALSVEPAPAGDWRVWVGDWSPSGGSATLVVGRDPLEAPGEALDAEASREQAEALLRDARLGFNIGGLDWEALRRLAETEGETLPALPEGARLELSASLSPAGEAGEAPEARFRIDLGAPGSLATSISGPWSEAMILALDAEAEEPPSLPIDELELTFRDGGVFLATLEVIAEEEGTTVEALMEIWRAALTLAAPPGEDGPVATLREAVEARLDAYDRPGTFTLRIVPAVPTPLEEISAALASGEAEDAAISIEASFIPKPTAPEAAAEPAPEP